MQRLSDSNPYSQQFNFLRYQAIIWDFDGVFYDFANLDGSGVSFYDLCDEANAYTTCRLLKGMEHEQARQLARTSFEKYNDPITGLIPVAQQYGYKKEDFVRKAFYGFNDRLAELVQQYRQSLFNPCPDALHRFTKGVGYIRHGLLTHSCTHRWAKPALQFLKKLDFFHPDHVMGFEDFDFKPKGQGVEGMDMLLERLNVAPWQAVFVEDTAVHLRVAKEKYPDMLCVWKVDQDEVEKPDYVDIVIRRPADLIDMMVKHRHHHARAMHNKLAIQP